MRDPVCIFIFRRDLRYEDNLALQRLMATFPKSKLYPVFIFNPSQIDAPKNPYYSGASVEFMIECIRDVRGIQCFYGDDIQVLNGILRKCTIEAIGFNEDHTPFAKARDLRVKQWCDSKGISVITARDYVLFDYENGPVQTESGHHYEVYTPFYKKCMKHIHTIPLPVIQRQLSITSRLTTISGVVGLTKPDTMMPKQTVSNRDIHGGRARALIILDRIHSKEFAKYDRERDFPAHPEKTTRLSAYLKFGCLSIREAFHACKKAYGIQHGLVRELLWREFYAQICWHMPRVLDGHPLKQKYETIITWQDGPKQADYFDAWCAGKTGFPFVDAGMKCLARTGFLHNRLRMVVAMFLTKDLMVDWRHGERYFATQLVDYDPASNSGGWQWAASVGADAQPYYRIFNPWLQSERFDKDATFIKTYLPELKHVPAQSIHQWYKDHEKYKHINYPTPIVDHKEQSMIVLSYFTQKQTP